jgi:hypothetical protein
MSARIIDLTGQRFGCPAEVLARALQRDSHNKPTGPLGIAFDLLLKERRS